MSRALTTGAMLAALLFAGPAAAKGRALRGSVVDRNGEPVKRVNVRLSPGNVEIITDDQGLFTIDYLRDAEGNRVKLQRKTTYTVEFFKVGFHPVETEVEYKRGELTIEAVTLKEDTIKLDLSADDIDPSRFPDRAQDGGGSYEGE
jgi:hypothetical protein